MVANSTFSSLDRCAAMFWPLSESYCGVVFQCVVSIVFGFRCVFVCWSVGSVFCCLFTFLSSVLTDWLRAFSSGYCFDGELKTIKNSDVNLPSDRSTEEQKSIHYLRFPGGPPPQYWASRQWFNFWVLMGSGALHCVWTNADNEKEGNDIRTRAVQDKSWQWKRVTGIRRT